MATDEKGSSAVPALPMSFFTGYFQWADLTGFSYYKTPDGEVWLPILLKLAEPAKDFAQGKLVGGENLPSGWEAWLRIPGAYANPPAGLEQYRFCTAWLHRKNAQSFFSELVRGGALANTIIATQLGAPGPLPKPSPPVAPYTLNPLPPRHVVSAIIDDGIAFAHERFRRSDGTTRFAYMWDQNDSAGVTVFGYGHESTGAQIDAETNLGVVAEDTVYRNLQYVDYSQSQHQALGRRVSHGTIAADLAFGLVPRDVPAGELPMIGVRLEDTATADTSGNQLKLPVIEALIYILLRADQIAVDAQCGPLPVVATLSYGFIAGPHDGCSLFEQAIDFILSLRSQVAPMRLVLPAGNWYLARCHTHLEIAAGSTSPALRWRVLPDGATGSFMEVWAVTEDPKVPPRIEVRVTDPRGGQSAWGLDHVAQRDNRGRVIWTFNSTPTTASDRVAILLWIAPTTALDPADAIAPSGTYTVEVRNVGAASCSVNAWIQRNDTPFGYPIRGRQSHFDDPLYERFKPSPGDLGGGAPSGGPQEVDNASYVKRFGTVSAMATSDQPIVIGGFRRSDRTASRYSAAGPTNALPKGCPATPRNGLDPDALAVSDDSVAMHGVLGGGSRSGSVVAMDGTSVAVPQIARKVWEDLRTGGAGDRAFVRGLAAAEAPNPPIPPERKGYGRITVEPVAPAPRFPGAQPIER
jgi:hypothetical protein